MRVHLVNADDWVIVYVNDIEVYQGHSVSAEEMLKLLDVSYTSEYVDDSSIDRRFW